MVQALHIARNAVLAYKQQIVFGGDSGGAAVVGCPGNDSIPEGGQERVIFFVCILKKGFCRLVQQKSSVRQP